MARERNTGGRVTPKGTQPHGGPDLHSGAPRRRPKWPVIIITVLILAGFILGAVASLFGASSNF